MLLIAEINIVTKLLNIVSEIKSGVRSVLLTNLLLIRDC